MEDLRQSVTEQRVNNNYEDFYPSFKPQITKQDPDRSFTLFLKDITKW